MPCDKSFAGSHHRRDTRFHVGCAPAVEHAIANFGLEEIVDMQISLIKWHTISLKDGTLQIVKTVLEGPKNIGEYLT